MRMQELSDLVVADILSQAYDLDPAEITRIPAGTATANFRVVDREGSQWFAKVYRDRAALRDELAAVELAEFARGGGVPVPGVRRTRGGEVIDGGSRLPMSLWEYVADAETAERGLAGDRWSSVGAVLGRLHGRLAGHPAAVPSVCPGAGVRDVVRSRRNFDWLIKEYGARGELDPFEEWALEAALERRALLDRAAGILAGLPDLMRQIIHGDLASPNLMLRGDEVAAVIDFQPPGSRFVAWEIARIGCDPRTVLLGDQWISGLAELLVAYRTEYPQVRVDELVSTVAVGCAYTLASTYPLAEPLEDPAAVNPVLQDYARARHQAALVMLARLDEVEEELRDRLG
jgi:Ser/Thr protein kinase RdoA (MazF antagonist)